MCRLAFMYISKKVVQKTVITLTVKNFIYKINNNFGQSSTTFLELCFYIIPSTTVKISTIKNVYYIIKNNFSHGGTNFPRALLLQYCITKCHSEDFNWQKFVLQNKE